MVVETPSYKTIRTEVPVVRKVVSYEPSYKTVESYIPSVQEYVTEVPMQRSVDQGALRSVSSRKQTQRSMPSGNMKEFSFNGQSYFVDAGFAQQLTGLSPQQQYTRIMEYQSSIRR